MTDVLVAGGGPVGLATAVLARQAGLSVVLVEPREGPVDKACGEGLMPTAVAALRRLGVDPPGADIAGIAYVRDRWRAEARFAPGPGRGVRRTELSAALSARADEVGVERLAGRVTGVVQDRGSVTAGGVRARWLVAADGLHSPLRRSLGLQAPPHGTPRFGLRRHYATAPWTDLVEVHWAADVEAYVTPVAPDLVGVAVLGPRGGSYDSWLAELPALRARLGPASGDVRGAGPLRQRALGVHRGRVLLVGDAAGYVDALTGEGIAVGMRAAEALVGCLVAGRPGMYPREWRRASRRTRALTSALLWVSGQPALRRTLVPAAVALPPAFTAAVNALA